MDPPGVLLREIGCYHTQTVNVL